MTAADPVRAAAWRLVSRQEFGRPFPPADKMAGGAEVLDEASSQAAVTLAKSLFERCCRQQRPAGQASTTAP